MSSTTGSKLSLQLRGWREVKRDAIALGITLESDCGIGSLKAEKRWSCEAGTMRKTRRRSSSGDGSSIWPRRLRGVLVRRNDSADETRGRAPAAVARKRAVTVAMVAVYPRRGEGGGGGGEAAIRSQRNRMRECSVGDCRGTMTAPRDLIRRVRARLMEQEAPPMDRGGGGGLEAGRWMDRRAG